MAVLAQHGAQKGSKLHRGLETNAISGVILSPKSETPDGLRSTVIDLSERFSSPLLLVDPQFYLNMLPRLEPGKFDRYADSLYFHPVTRRDLSSPKRVVHYVESIIAYQASMPVSHLVSPSVLIESFRDKSSQISISLMEASIDHVTSIGDGRPCILALTINESSFDSEEDVSEFLDILTSVEAARGFYIVINSPDPDRVFSSVSALERFMYFIYVLGELNGFEVIVGFTGTLGLLFEAAGASHVGVGWYKKQQSFSMNHHLPVARSGGRQPTPRYLSTPLLDNLKIVPTMTVLAELGYLDEVRSDTQFDADILDSLDPERWGVEIRSLHAWDALQRVSAELAELPDTKARIAKLLERIAGAIVLYDSLLAENIPFDARTVPLHLSQWNQALHEFSTRLRS